MDSPSRRAGRSRCDANHGESFAQSLTIPAGTATRAMRPSRAGECWPASSRPVVCATLLLKLPTLGRASTLPGCDGALLICVLDTGTKLCSLASSIAPLHTARCACHPQGVSRISRCQTFITGTPVNFRDMSPRALIGPVCPNRTTVFHPRPIVSWILRTRIIESSSESFRFEACISIPKRERKYPTIPPRHVVTQPWIGGPRNYPIKNPKMDGGMPPVRIVCVQQFCFFAASQQLREECEC